MLQVKLLESELKHFKSSKNLVIITNEREALTLYKREIVRNKLGNNCQNLHCLF